MTNEQLEPQVKAALDRASVRALVEIDDGSLWIDEPNGSKEVFVVVSDTRHGKQGLRLLRYTHDTVHDAYDWDEQYQFYLSVDEMVAAIKNADYSQGRQAF